MEKQVWYLLVLVAKFLYPWQKYFLSSSMRSWVSSPPSATETQNNLLNEALRLRHFSALTHAFDAKLYNVKSSVYED